MQIKIFLYYILGYVNVIIEGYFIEKVLNVCKVKNVLLWNNKREKATVLNTNVSIKNFRQLCAIIKECKCKIRINNKKGLPFILHRYKKRKMFTFLFFLVIFMIIFLSSFVWNIEITGNINIPSEEILKIVNNEGLNVGIFKNRINTKEIINKLRLYRNDLAWAGIEIKGTNAKIKIVEAQKKPDIVKEDEYCNIIATKDGIITKINAINGTPLVKEGETVKKGTILIGGYIEGKYTKTRYVHANGDVYAKVWYLKKQKIEENIVKLTKTENEENRYSVKFNNFQINFYKTLSNFEIYDTIISRKKIKLFSNFYLPIEIIKYTNVEQKEEHIEYSLEEAKNNAIENIKKELDKQIEGNDNNIINTYINYDEQTKEITVIYEMQELIGTKEKIEF